MSPNSVLVIDDEPGIREIVRETALTLCSTVYEASSGSEGLKLIQAHQPSVIVSDYNMPGLNGLELLRFIRDVGCAAPVVWMTGRGSPGLFREAWRVGVYEIFEKPFDMGDLRRCLEAALVVAAGLPSHEKSGSPEQGTFTSNQIFYKDVGFHLDRQLHQQLIEECLRQGISITTYLTRLVQKQLESVASTKAPIKKDAA